MKITVIGTGAYSIGIALMLAKKNENNINITQMKSQNILE